MSAFPERSESKLSHRPSGESVMLSTVWLPIVTCVARSTDTGPSVGIGIAHTFACEVYAEYASRLPSAERLIECALSPVVSRDGFPAGIPPLVTRTVYTSRAPSRLETKRRRSPSGVQAGLTLRAALSVTGTGTPPAAG